MTNAGFIVGGIILITLAGVLNGSWNASFNPLANLAVGKTRSQNSSSTPNDLTYHHAFALFQIYAVIFNIPICLYWAGGPNRVSAILTETPPVSIALVVVFSLLWGVGTLLFGIACKVAGVGLGTNLTMGIIAVLGTFLPLITQNILFSPFGAIVCAGLAICCLGLWLATKALSLRDEDERQAKSQSNKNHFPLSLDDGEDDGDFIPSNSIGQEDTSTENTSRNPEKKEYSALQKILVCLAAGATAVQLQFAFIFGAPITDLTIGKKAESLPGKTPFGGSAVIIWLLAISLGAPVAIVNGIVSSSVPLSQALKAPWWRHLRLIVSTSLPWIAHIHIYGLCATTLLPESIGWPLLMMITNLWALVLSKFLGEWKDASQKTVRTFAYSLGVTIIGLLVLMCSVAVPTNT